MSEEKSSHQKVKDALERLLKVVAEKKLTGKYVLRMVAYQGGMRDYEILVESDLR